MVSTEGNRAEISLPFIDQAFKVLFDAFQYDFNRYLRESKKHTNTPSVVEGSGFTPSNGKYNFASA